MYVVNMYNRRSRLYLFLTFFASTLHIGFKHAIVKKRHQINKISETLTSILSNLNNFHPLEGVDRVSETQLQVAENSNF